MEQRNLLAVAALTPVADTSTQTWDGAGAAQVLFNLDRGGGDEMSYLRFDLSSINIDTITSAELTLHKVPGSRNDTIVESRFDTYGLSNFAGNTPQGWGESSLKKNTAGGEYASTGGDGIDITRVFNLNAEEGADVVETVDNSITAQRLSGPDIVEFLNTRNADSGLATFITLIDAGRIRGWGYASREAADPALRPILTIEYDPAPTPPRQVERLNRGLVAVRGSDNSAYIGWRSLADDPNDMAFNLYRSTGSGTPVKINSALITETTDYTDSTADFSQTNTYSVRPVVDGIEQPFSDSFTIAASATVQQRISVPLQIPAAGPDYTYSANDASVGDVDGDGEYEIILKWDPSNSKDNSQSGTTGRVYIDAYKMSGERLWRIDLGQNIRAGAHYTQFQVYDYDGDGKAEIMMRTAPGTIDGDGVPVLLPGDRVTDDYRDSRGYVLTGPEYMTVFSGETGAALATVPLSPARGSVSEWGDNYGNRVDRFTAATAYLDGARPSFVIGRGYYHARAGGAARNEVAAYDYRDGQLTLRWIFESGEGINGNVNSSYVGQGAHSLTIGDVDGDGRDEIVYGAAVIDNDGTGLYSTQLGHGDALHLSDMDPSRPGLEVFMVHESPSEHNGVGGEYRDAQTGDLIFSIYGSGDIGRGVAADIDPNHPGFEMWATTDDRGIYNVDGTRLYDTPSNMFYNSLVWWDGDLSRELLDRTTISKWNSPGRSNFDLDPGTGGTQIFAPDASSNNSTKANAVLSADILGDWREEVIWRRSDSSALDIYTTIIPSQQRITTLMHDTHYRVAVAWQNTGYNQPPHTSFYLGTGMADPPAADVYFADFNADLSPPIVIDVSPSGHSSVDRLTVEFEREVSIDPDAFSVIQRSDQSGQSGTAIETTFSWDFVDGNTVATITFLSGTRNASGALRDGNYELTIDHTKITRMGSTQTMAVDYVFGDEESEAFYALFGDVNGDRKVGTLDYLAMRRAYLTQVGDARFNTSFDYDGDGRITSRDLLWMRRSYRTLLLF